MGATRGKSKIVTGNGCSYLSTKKAPFLVDSANYDKSKLHYRELAGGPELAMRRRGTGWGSTYRAVRRNPTGWARPGPGRRSGWRLPLRQQLITVLYIDYTVLAQSHQYTAIVAVGTEEVWILEQRQSSRWTGQTELGRGCHLSGVFYHVGSCFDTRERPGSGAVGRADGGVGLQCRL